MAFNHFILCCVHNYFTHTHLMRLIASYAACSTDMTRDSEKMCAIFPHSLACTQRVYVLIEYIRCIYHFRAGFLNTSANCVHTYLIMNVKSTYHHHTQHITSNGYKTHVERAVLWLNGIWSGPDCITTVSVSGLLFAAKSHAINSSGGVDTDPLKRGSVIFKQHFKSIAPIYTTYSRYTCCAPSIECIKFRCTSRSCNETKWNWI